MSEGLARRAARFYSHLLATLQRLFVEGQNELPRISDKALSLEAPPSVPQALAWSWITRARNFRRLPKPWRRPAWLPQVSLEVEHRATVDRAWGLAAPIASKIRDSMNIQATPPHRAESGSACLASVERGISYT